MSILKKSWKYQNGNDEIIVQYDYNLSFKNASVKTIKLNNKIIFQSSYNYLHLEKRDECSFEKDNLRVVLGLHLRCIRRCHIYIDNKLVGGDVDKQIYMPHMALKIFTCISLVFAVGIWCLTLLALTENYFDDRKLETRVRSDDLNLYQDEVCSFFKGNEYHELKKEKFTSWSKKCEEGQSEFCRLTSYLYCSDRLQSKAFPVASKGCHDGSILSCYAAYDNVTVNYQSPEYKEITNKIKSFCLEGTLKNKRQQTMCRNFSWRNSRIYGDLISLRGIANQLCEQKNDASCKDLKWLDHQKDEICLAGDCKDPYD